MHSIWDADSLLDRAQELLKKTIDEHTEYNTAELDRSHPVKTGTDFARLLGFTVRMHVVKRRRAVKRLVCSRREQSIAVVIVAEGLDVENCLSTEYSGYASTTTAAVAVTGAV